MVISEAMLGLFSRTDDGRRRSASVARSRRRRPDKGAEIVEPRRAARAESAVGVRGHDEDAQAVVFTFPVFPDSSHN